MTSTQERYTEALRNIPPPGSGCHVSLLSVANYGVMAGLEPQKLHDDIRQSIPPGARRIPDREIQDAINKALQDRNGGTFTPRPRPRSVVNNGKTTLQKIIDQGKTRDEADLWESSPVHLWDEPQNDAALFLSFFYEPAALIFIGERAQGGILGDTIRTAAEWINHFKNGGKTAPFIIINPLNGIPALVKSGDKTTLRGDGNIASFRYCLVEFDALPREDQIRFWSSVKLPIRALIDTGGKSIHGWLDVRKLAKVETPEQWATEIKEYFYDRILTPLGVDKACSNPARLSRLPGHFREGKKAWQRLLWLSPEGKPLC